MGGYSHPARAELTAIQATVNQKNYCGGGGGGVPAGGGGGEPADAEAPPSVLQAAAPGGEGG